MNSFDVLIVMTRLPREGKNKTRLIPELGSAGATAFHDQLARHTISHAVSFVSKKPETRLNIHLEGGTPADGQAWLGNFDFFPQHPGDLGMRMQSAVEHSFAEGARKVVVIGTDCPALDEAILEKAFELLSEENLVFGPATDGGYYLVGLSVPCTEIFKAVEWSTSKVLAQSLASAKKIGLGAALLEALSDVDFPTDLPAAREILSAKL